MQRAVVTTVALLAVRHALLDAEDLVAQRQRRIELVLSSQPPNLEVDGAVGPTRFHSWTACHTARTSGDRNLGDSLQRADGFPRSVRRSA